MAAAARRGRRRPCPGAAAVYQFVLQCERAAGLHARDLLPQAQDFVVERLDGNCRVRRLLGARHDLVVGLAGLAAAAARRLSTIDEVSSSSAGGGTGGGRLPPSVPSAKAVLIPQFTIAASDSAQDPWPSSSLSSAIAALDLELRPGGLSRNASIFCPLLQRGALPACEQLTYDRAALPSSQISCVRGCLSKRRRASLSFGSFRVMFNNGARAKAPHVAVVGGTGASGGGAACVGRGLVVGAEHGRRPRLKRYLGLSARPARPPAPRRVEAAAWGPRPPGAPRCLADLVAGADAIIANKNEAGSSRFLRKHLDVLDLPYGVLPRHKRVAVAPQHDCLRFFFFFRRTDRGAGAGRRELHGLEDRRELASAAAAPRLQRRRRPSSAKRARSAE